LFVPGLDCPAKFSLQPGLQRLDSLIAGSQFGPLAVDDVHEVSIVHVGGTGNRMTRKACSELAKGFMSGSESAGSCDKRPTLAPVF
jgi:hypothetical protein